jgi:hypothetical protein
MFLLLRNFLAPKAALKVPSLLSHHRCWKAMHLRRFTPLTLRIPTTKATQTTMPASASSPATPAWTASLPSRAAPSGGAGTPTAPFQTTAYYAPQFAELRRRCVGGGEPAFLASISRCRKWQTKGGKSAAYFAKTRDDRASHQTCHFLCFPLNIFHQLFFLRAITNGVLLPSSKLQAHILPRVIRPPFSFFNLFPMF